MAQDTSPEAYEQYLGQAAMLERTLRRLNPSLPATPPLSYEEWQKLERHRDHPRWPEFMDARWTWKTLTFHAHYGPHPVAMQPFPAFLEWLEIPEDQKPDYPVWLATQTAAEANKGS